MSEYQYFEFAAIDEPLNEKQMRELRAISTRAEITPTSFWNEYHFGDFKGEPRKMVADYFDAFIHYANWGTLWCMFRLPKEAVDVKALKQFITPDAIDVVVKCKHVIVDLHLEDEPGDYETPYEQSLGELLLARAALLEGDLGPLYVAWLAAVQRRLVEDDALEPCDVGQLPAMGAGTRAVADFLGVGSALLKAAYQPARKKIRVDDAEELVKWVKSLPPKQKDEYLARFIAEPANVVRSKLRKQFRDTQAQDAVDSESSERRMVTRLLSAVEFDS